MRGGGGVVGWWCLEFHWFVKQRAGICNSSKGRVIEKNDDSSWIPVLTCKMNKKCNVLWPEKKKMSGASVIMIC